MPLLAAALFVSVIAAAYLAVPGLVRSAGQGWVGKNLKNKQMAIGTIGFDPWNLTLDIRKIAIADRAAPGVPLVAIEHLVVDASISSLWKLSPQLDSVSVEAPAVDLVLRKDGSVNPAELVPVDDGSPVPQLWIGNLDVRGGRVRFTDDRGSLPRHEQTDPVTFALRDFSTVATSAAGFRFDACSEAGERFHWAGTIGMAPLASTGQFSIGGLKLATITKLADALLPVIASDGALSLAGNYRFAVPVAVARAGVGAGAGDGVPAPSMQFRADLSRLALADAAVRLPTGDVMRVQSLNLAPTQITLAGDAVAHGTVTATGIGITRPAGETLVLDGVTLQPSRYALKTGTAYIGALSLAGVALKGRGPRPGSIVLASLDVAPSWLRLADHTGHIGQVVAKGMQTAAQIGIDHRIRIPGLYPLQFAGPASAAGPTWH